VEWKDLSREEKFELILPGIKEGKTNTHIARELGISEKTVRGIIQKSGYKRDDKDNKKLIKLDNINKDSESITDTIHKGVSKSYTVAIQNEDSSSYTAAIQTHKVVENTNIVDIEVIEFFNDIKKEIQSIKRWQQERILKDKVIDKVIEEYEEAKKKEQIIELEPVEIKLDEKIGVKGKAVGVRIDEEVYKEWVEFTKAYNKYFKSHQLLSQALIEFMKKYK
jgi:uncharacterized protein YerC